MALQPPGQQQRDGQGRHQQQRDDQGIALQLRGQLIGAGVDKDPADGLPTQAERAHHLDAAEPQRGNVHEDPVTGLRRLQHRRRGIPLVAREALAGGVIQCRVADLVFAAQAGQVLLRRLRRIEVQRRQAVVADYHRQHLQVPRHLLAQHDDVVDHEQGAGDHQRQHADGRGQGQQTPADRGHSRQSHCTTSATS
jgi:hypothetical protein